MQKYTRFIIVVIFTLTFYSETFAQTDTLAKAKKDTIDYYDLSLEQLLKIKAHGVPSELEKLINELISVASKKPLNTRESPSIVSLITEEEIKRSGARDLIDVLRLVPGFDFGVDVEGVVGLGLRGNWAHEGKILVLLDGQETNEILFATTQLGNHYPIEQIKRIEIIRGPGSAIYGGFAEYGVINIITKKGEDINGLMVSGTYGRYEKDLARQNANIMIGKKTGNLEYSLSGMMGQANRSDQYYTDFSDSTYKMAGNSSLNPTYVNGAISYKGLSFRAIGDFYKTSMRDGYGTVVNPGAVTETFNSMYSELKYVWTVSNKLTITPRLNFKNQAPWKSSDYEGKAAYDRTATRTTGNVTSVYNINRNINVVGGAEYYQDHATDKVDSSYFSAGSKDVSYYNYAFFAQGLIKTRPVNIILGARYDQHNVYGHAFVPRVGLTKKYGRFHFKALYSGSFRAPAIENINYQTDDGIKPELTQVAEVELGYQITRKSIFTINVFDITTNNPIVYSTDSANNDIYTNSGGAGTQGVEAEYRIKAQWGYVTANYAFYTAAYKKKISDYEVGEDKAALTGFANHKASLNASLKIINNLTVNPSVVFYGARWGYTSVDTAGNSVIEKFDPTVLVNLFVWYKSPVEGLSIGLGGYDLLNQKYKFIQPYNGYHAPLPGPSREFMIRLQYTLQYKKI
jgi:outer membrane receptor for ferrienterochelin and colicin